MLPDGKAIEIAEVNPYSWYPDTRGPQLYKMYASDGTGPNFNVAPSSKLDPTSCGWKLIAFGDTRSSNGDDGGQYGVSIAGAGGSLGKYCYLLFDGFETESEVDVAAKQ